MKRIHFISGLPRSGSTLLAGILRQNPRFHAAMTGPVGTLFGACLTAMSAQSETAVFLDEDRRRRVLHGLFDSFYGDRPEEVVFDTNRAWTARLPAVRALFPESKILCCVRDVAWIMDSIERLTRKNAFMPSKLFGTPEERATVFSRTEALAHRDRMVGYAWSALKEAYYGEHSSSLLIVEYDILVQRPKDAVKLIYGFLEEEPFEHDFDNVEYDEPEFDRQMGAPGLHTVRGKVEWKPRKTVLPPDLFEKFANLSFWRDPKGSASWRITVQQKKALGDTSPNGGAAGEGKTIN